MIDEKCEMFLEETVKAFVKKRKELGVSQKEMGAKTGRPQSVFGRYEGGTNTNVRLSTFYMLCKAIDVNPADILEVSFAKVEGIKKKKPKKLTLRQVERKISGLNEQSKDSFIEMVNQLADMAKG